MNTPSTAFTLPPTVRLVPLKVKLLLSSSSPPVPTITTLSLVKSETFADVAVTTPEILTLSNSV